MSDLTPHQQGTDRTHIRMLNLELKMLLERIQGDNQTRGGQSRPPQFELALNQYIIRVQEPYEGEDAEAGFGIWLLDIEENPLHILWSQEGYLLATQLGLVERLRELSTMVQEARTADHQAHKALAAWMQQVRDNPLHPLHSTSLQLFQELGLDRFMTELLWMLEADKAMRELATRPLS